MSRLFLLLTWGVWIGAWAEDAAGVFAAKIQAIKTIRADFDQEVVANHRNISSASGHMLLIRPNQLSWHTTKPMEQWVIADGRCLWVYDVDLEQVTVAPQTNDLQRSRVGFLLGKKVDLLRTYRVTGQPQLGIFELVARLSSADLVRVKVQFNGDALTRMELFDALGQQTKITFKRIEMNQFIPAKAFHFQTPAGVDVIHQGDGGE